MTWSRECSVRLRGLLCLALSPSLSFPLSPSLSIFFFFFYRECILSESIKTAPGSSVFADSCGATQLKEVLVSSAREGGAWRWRGGDSLPRARKLQPKPAPGLHPQPLLSPLH